MRRTAVLLTVTAIAIVSWFLSLAGQSKAQAPENVVAVITSPVDGEQLFGLVNVLGSAGHASTFESYTLEYSNQATSTVTWLLVQPRVRQQVQNGVLGTWNTNVIPDGVYRLRLRVFLDDGYVGEYVVTNLRVINTKPTPVPTAPSSDLGAPANQPTPGPSPTSPIVQPPSNNPTTGDFSDLNPGDEQVPPAASSSIQPADSTSDKTTRINLARVRNAFCSGVYFAFAGFSLVLGYILVRKQTRPIARHLIQRSHEDWKERL